LSEEDRTDPMRLGTGSKCEADDGSEYQGSGHINPIPGRYVLALSGFPPFPVYRVDREYPERGHRCLVFRRSFSQ
jgi:hypothetical protein